MLRWPASESFAAADSGLALFASSVHLSYLGTLMLLRLASAIVCLAVLLPGQGGETGEADVRAAEGERRMKAAQGERGEKGEVEDDKNLTPEQRLARNITSGASNYCRLMASVTPAKLLPGQSGTLRILATLQGHAVLPSPAPIEMLGQAQQGAVTLGALAARPADAGRLEKGYLGRPVYENYAVFEVPVTMAPTAVIGSKHTVAVDLKFDLYDGNSAQAIGRFLDRAATEIEVGRTLDPEVKGVPRRAETPPVAAVQAPAGVANEAPVVAPPPAPLQANAVVPEPTRPTPAATSTKEAVAEPVAQLPVEDEGGGLPMPLLVGGGALLLAVVLLLARKK